MQGYWLEIALSLGCIVAIAVVLCKYFAETEPCDYCEGTGIIGSGHCCPCCNGSGKKFKK
ncbi:membrane protein [Shigella phage Silverhawkium]|uniref:Membrane protein n=1 Tax=Shigella phage Silverhawkium TaxID=2530185 RepID=A0A482JL56_9CAUD|nr:membrane protein [Shigella phage Silverhawkium]